MLVKADITSELNVARLFSVAAEQLGTVTGVVNNAAATLHIGDVADTPAAAACLERVPLR